MMPRLATFPLVLLVLPARGRGVRVDAATPQDVAAYLTAHNTVRAQHGAEDLVWNETLANAAQSWVNSCKFKHSGGSLGPYGGTPRSQPLDVHAGAYTGASFGLL